MIAINEILAKTQELSVWLGQKVNIHATKNGQRSWTVKRGEVYFVNLGQNIGSEENKIRPFVVIQSNSYGTKSPVFLGAIISSSTVTISDIQIPITGSYTYNDKNGNAKQLVGAIDLGQLRTIAKERIVRKIATLSVELDEMDDKIPNITGIKPIIIAKDNKIAYLNGKIEYLQTQLDELRKKLAEVEEKE